MISHPYVDDAELALMLSVYDENAFTDVPYWIRHQIRGRGITFERRHPTPQEVMETEVDAKYHRITHNERNIQDFKDKYLNKGVK